MSGDVQGDYSAILSYPKEDPAESVRMARRKLESLGEVIQAFFTHMELLHRMVGARVYGFLAH